MASAASHASFLPPVLTFCAAAVIAVPLFRRLGLSAVIGYLAAGVVIGPAGFSLIDDPGTAASVAELGVVLLLFIVGLELKLSRLLSMRGDIFGLGLAQLGLTALLLGGAAVAAGFGPKAAVVTGLALALSATAIALQMLEERGDLSEPYGQRAFAVLLFQDLAIVPILALLPLLATAAAPPGPPSERLASAGIAVAAIAAVVIVGRYGLNPFFRLLAASGAREVLTASALLVVLGTALLLEDVGLSMAMGAFLAGVLLAESNFRHQLEADIEPFRGILLGLFFMSVGMSIDAGEVAANGLLLLAATPAVVATKIALIGCLMRATGSSWRDAAQAGAVLAPAGEFAFVLLPLGAGLGLLAPAEAALVTALAALTMLLGPLVAKALDVALDRFRPAVETQDEDFEGAGGRVLVIGFGRFGQTVNQVLLAQGIEVTVIDRDVDRIRGAGRFGFRVFYGDGTRLDVLRAAGAGRAEVICICVDDREAALKIVEIVHAEFPQVRTYARAFDRIHAIDLLNLDVDHQTREVFESALSFGRAALEELGVEPADAASLVADVRRRDVARLMMQKVEGLMGGRDLMHNARLTPEPLTAPKVRARGLSAETREILGEDGEPVAPGEARIGERA
jgi:monovalent cation:proton antiporter-2 (CPA2) family protein